MKSAYHYLATSDDPVARVVRGLRRQILDLTLPAPRLIVKPMLWSFLALRAVYYYCTRLLICEPLFKANCRSYGQGVRTGVYIHWVQGKGDIVLGDHVLIDGKCSFSFASRFSPRPTLKIGDATVVGHNCRFTVGKEISIGRHCLIAADVWIFDSPGHPADPSARLAGLPPSPDEVRPIVIEDNVWIGSRSIICPGVTIGAGSIVSAGSIVATDVPANSLMAGNSLRRAILPLGNNREAALATAMS